jgi:hypothetical protein
MASPARTLLRNATVLVVAFGLAHLVMLATSLQSPDSYRDFAHAVIVRFLPIALLFALASSLMCLLLQAQRRWTWALALGALRALEFLALSHGLAELPFNAEVAQWYGSELLAPILGAWLGWLAFELTMRRKPLGQAESA